MGRLSGIRVLHVDHETGDAEGAAGMLERENDRLAVETAASVREGLDRLPDGQPDCVVASYELPGTNGVEALESVREDRPELPFVIFTDAGSEEIASAAISAGVSEYLERTPGAGQYGVLADRIVTAVKRHRARIDERTRVRRLELLRKNSRNLLFLLDGDRTCRFVGSAVERFLGFAPADVEGRPGEEYIHPDDRESFVDAYRQARANSREVIDRTYQVRHEDGSWRWIESRKCYRPGIDAVVVDWRDVTERVERERELEAARDRYEMLFENNPIVVWEHDFSDAKTYLDELAAECDDLGEYFDANPGELLDVFERSRPIDVNRNAVEYYGADSKSHLLDNVDQVLGDEAWELTRELWQSVAAGETRFNGETVAHTFGGDRRHQILDLYVPESHADDYGRVYMTGTDVTALKRREHELERERDRLDEFASVVSHDLRNPLHVADGKLELARQECPADHLDEATAALDRMDRLIENLLELAREGERATDREPVALADLAETCRASVGTGDASLVVETDVTVRAVRSRLRQLLENLVRNAVEHGSTSPGSQAHQDAVEHGSTSPRSHTPEDAVEHGSTDPDSQAHRDGRGHGDSGVTITVGDFEHGFYVADDGPGIPAEERSEVFGAGYSTSEDGTGFGLAIVQEISEAHGWQARATGSETGGARIEIVGVDFVSDYSRS
jgi:PAS domain S-box-containing protein